LLSASSVGFSSKNPNQTLNAAVEQVDQDGLSKETVLIIMSYVTVINKLVFKIFQKFSGIFVRQICFVVE